MKFILKFKITNHYMLIRRFITNRYPNEKVVSSFYSNSPGYTDITNKRILKRFGNEN